MQKTKIFKFSTKGRRWFFSVALFLLVFSAASVVKIQAAGNVTGWLWGGTEDVLIGGTTGDNNAACKSFPAPAGCIDGNETIVGWVSMTGANYGITIPSSDGPVTGYAWMNAGGNPDNGLQNGIGWIDFNPQDHCTTGVPGAGQYRAASCDPSGEPGLSCSSIGVKRVGNNLLGCARIVEIAKATLTSNSGGWYGWLKFSNSYGGGIDVTKLDGAGTNKMYAWSSELGWIDFSRAKLLTPINGQCKTPPHAAHYCSGVIPNPGTMSPSELCQSYDPDNPPSVSGTWSWTCSGKHGGSSMSCSAFLGASVIPVCGSPSFCSESTSGAPEACASGTPSAYSALNSYEVKWTCAGSCPATTINCSAPGYKACGHIEVNP